MYGITRDQVREFFEELKRANPNKVTDVDFRRLQSSMCMCALNCAWQQLCELQPMWISPESPPVSIRTLRKDFHRVADLCCSLHLMNPKLRFKHGISWLTDVACMLDVTTIPCRSRMPQKKFDPVENKMKTKDATYSGKHREHCFKVEFWLTLSGVPFCFRGPIVGSYHDAKIYKNTLTHGTPLFDHHNQELFLADLGYIGCDHCFVPYKAPVRGVLTDKQRHFNNVHSWIRSIIERCFAHFDKFCFFHGTDHDRAWLKSALKIVSVAVYGLLAAEPQYDFDGVINSDLKEIDESSFCWCSKGCGIVDPMHSRREWLTEHIHPWAASFTPPPYRSCILFDFGNIWYGTVFRSDRLESAVVFTRATLICSETLKFLSNKSIFFCSP